jgi:hypothetical protein
MAALSRFVALRFALVSVASTSLARHRFAPPRSTFGRSALRRPARRGFEPAKSESRRSATEGLALKESAPCLLLASSRSTRPKSALRSITGVSLERFAVAWHTAKEKGDWLPAWMPLNPSGRPWEAGCLSPFSARKPREKRSRQAFASHEFIEIPRSGPWELPLAALFLCNEYVQRC